MLDREVSDIDLDSIKGFGELLESYCNAGGFMAPKIGEAYKLMSEMFNGEYTVFISFPADLVATGLRGVFRKLVEAKLVDYVITTCGTWDHDIARTLDKYYVGNFYMDDVELHKKNIHRLGNVLVPRDSYGVAIENFMRPLLESIYKEGVRGISTYELSWRMGEQLKPDSILYWAHKNKVPIIVPGPYDGAVGYQIWLFQQFHKDFRLDLYRDEKLLSDAVFEARKTGAIIIGGGISKHHLLWWNQFRGGLDIAIQITTGVELDGSLTGARLSEAITWGKVRPTGKEVSIWGEASVIFPILVKAVLENLRR